jgi:hypothetical protein
VSNEQNAPLAVMSDAAVAAIPQPSEFELVGPDRWVRDIEVSYQLAPPSWRPAREGETCSQGGGGHGAWKTTACRQPAVVTHESMRGSKPYRSGRCDVHAGGRVPLADGRVVEPVTNPLGGA